MPEITFKGEIVGKCFQ